MKKKHGLFFGFAALFLAVIFTFAACDKDGGSNSNCPNGGCKNTGGTDSSMCSKSSCGEWSRNGCDC
ncbi:MAG: hypothetical protein LBG73_00045 [Spirochaetaceae bacterium]|nr:hypothetical protein [Spirochaetaceae bacterium]